MQACLDAYVEVEKLEGDNAYNCNTCQQQVEATKKLSLHRLPPVLVLHLNRFACNTMNERFSVLAKVSSHLNTQHQLSMQNASSCTVVSTTACVQP